MQIGSKLYYLAVLTWLGSAHLAAGQMNTWQQEVHYRMQVELNTENHRLQGQQELRYINHSPDTLREVFYHLYFNAFQPNSMMDTRSRNLPDPDGRVKDRIQKLKPSEIGYQRIKNLRQNDTSLNYQVRGTVLQAKLAKPLAPGDTGRFAMQFESQVPVQIRRSGRNNEEGIDYTMTQWYPKMAAYDAHGWHPDPYVAREYYAPFGRFEVSITLDSEQRLAATGLLQNPEKYWQKDEEIGDGLFRYTYKPGEAEQRTWRFVAEDVHTFAWGADPDYIHTQTTGPDSLALHFYYQKKYRETWEQLPDYTRRFFAYMNAHFGRYIYPQFSVIQGGDGGMEYPMCTMLKGTGELEGLVGVTAHEGAHSWFYGMLATNENSYPWMDEGFTSYAEEEVLNSFRDTPRVNAHTGAYRNHRYMAQKDKMTPMTTAADFYAENLRYGINAYSRGELFINQLRPIMGDSLLQETMLRYYERWKLRHPGPRDFMRVAEEVSGLHLDWYRQFWIATTHLIDYGIAEVSAPSSGALTELRLEKLEEMPMPLRLTVRMRDGETREFYIPTLMQMGLPHGLEATALPTWPWTHPEYEVTLPIPFAEVDKIYLDRYGFMSDVNRANNQYPREENQ